MTQPVYVHAYGLDLGTDGPSLAEQEAAARAYFDAQQPLGTFGDRAEWSRWYADAPGTAGIAWLKRPQGESVALMLAPGDHVIAHKAAAFRSLADAADVLALVDELEVTLHVPNITGKGFDLNTSTDFSLQLLAVMESFAELEREQHSRQTRQGLAKRREAGLPLGGPPPLGWLRHGKGAESTLKPAPKDRRIARYVARLHDEERLTFAEIFWRLRKENVRRQNGDPVTRYAAYKFYRAGQLGFPLPGGVTSDG